MWWWMFVAVRGLWYKQYSDFISGQLLIDSLISCHTYICAWLKSIYSTLDIRKVQLNILKRDAYFLSVWFGHICDKHGDYC